MTQYTFYFNGKRCTGCKTCELACKDRYDLTPEISYRKVFEYGGGDWTKDADGFYVPDVFTYYVSVACNHCDDPACMKVCPTGAMQKSDETGLVTVDADRCIGCGYCHMACPYNAPKVDREKGHTVKCDGCAERVAAGQKPICVEACPLRALDFGTKDEMTRAHGDSEVADIAPLPQKDYTHPNLLIDACDHAQMANEATGKVANILEVM